MKLEFNFNQSAVIPYRLNDGNLEILLITSMKKKKWIVPKGFIEFNLTPFESAKKEAYEEAGVMGTNETHELGYFNLDKSMGVCHVKVFSMEVLKELESYPEKNDRKRRWFLDSEAVEKVSIPEISEMIKALKGKLKK